jgi:hypothetical protein
MTIAEVIEAFFKNLFEEHEVQGLTVTYTYCQCEHCQEREVPLRTFEVRIAGRGIIEVFDIRASDLRDDSFSLVLKLSIAVSSIFTQFGIEAGTITFVLPKETLLAYAAAFNRLYGEDMGENEERVQAALELRKPRKTPLMYGGSGFN